MKSILRGARKAPRPPSRPNGIARYAPVVFENLSQRRGAFAAEADSSVWVPMWSSALNPPPRRLKWSRPYLHPISARISSGRRPRGTMVGRHAHVVDYTGTRGIVEHLQLQLLEPPLARLRSIALGCVRHQCWRGPSFCVLAGPRPNCVGVTAGAYDSRDQPQVLIR